MYNLIVLTGIERYPSLSFPALKKAFQTEVRPEIEGSDRSAHHWKLLIIIDHLWLSLIIIDYRWKAFQQKCGLQLKDQIALHLWKKKKLYGFSTWKISKLTKNNCEQEKVLSIARDSRAECVKIHGDKNYKNCKHFVPDLRPKSIVYKNSWQGSISAMTIYRVVKPFYDIAVRPFCKKPPLFRSRSIDCSKTINQNACLA